MLFAIHYMDHCMIYVRLTRNISFIACVTFFAVSISSANNQQTLNTSDNSSAILKTYQNELTDLSLNETQRLVIEQKYLDCISKKNGAERLNLMRSFIRPLLSDPSVSYDRKLLGIQAASKLLDIKFDKPDPKKVNDYSLDVLKKVVAPTKEWNSDKQGLHILCMTHDNDGGIYIGTEDHGIYYAHPDTGIEWKNYTTSDGLGDNHICALTCDKFGRVWAGHINHGVSIFDGKKWHNYDSADGPGAEHIFAMTQDQLNGDVWIATNCGLSRYNHKKNKWDRYTKINGFPEDNITSVAVDKFGNVYAGTSINGLLIGSITDEYAHWRNIKSEYDPFPFEPNGNGLPANLINAVLVLNDDSVWVGTSCGLAYSMDQGQNWKFIRGSEWAYKANGLKSKYAEIDWAKNDNVPTISEDYVSCLEKDDNGFLYVGYRQNGYEIWDTKKNQRIYPLDDPAPGFYMYSILPIQKGYVLLGRYGEGLIQQLPRFSVAYTENNSYYGVKDNSKQSKRIATMAVSLPAPASAPNLTDLKQMVRIVQSACTDKTRSNFIITPINDDWLTIGDWLGRYGRYWSCLSAYCSPYDYTWGAGWKPIAYDSNVGPEYLKKDSIRYWVHWLYTTNPNSLEMPLPYLHSRVLRKATTWDVNRRQSDWDDHGEEYWMLNDGPDIYTNIEIPYGTYYLSLYLFNKDAQYAYNRYRDYKISIKLHPDYCPLGSIGDFDARPELVNGRVKDFSGGVYKRFVVQGPVQLTIRLDRNNSFNTTLSGLMLDLVDEDPAPYFHTVDEWNVQSEARSSQLRHVLFENINKPLPNDEQRLVKQLSVALDYVRYSNPTWWAANKQRFYLPLLRWYRAKVDQEYRTASLKNKVVNKDDNYRFVDKTYLTQLAHCYYECNMFEKWEQCGHHLGNVTARDIEKSLRWDGVSAEGEGYKVVTDYLAQNHNTKTSMNR